MLQNVANYVMPVQQYQQHVSSAQRQYLYPCSQAVKPGIVVSVVRCELKHANVIEWERVK